MGLQRRIDAHHLRIRLAVQKAGEAIEGIATDADAGRRRLALRLAPGAIALTRMCCGATSCARLSIISLMPPFDVA